MLNYFLYLAGAIVAVFNHIKDWNAHKTFWRRWIVLLMIISIGIAGITNNYFTDKKTDEQHIAELQEIKREIMTEKLHEKIEALQAKIDESQKILDSKKASLIFSFGGRSKDAIRATSLPVKDNKVHVDFSIWNNTDTTAMDVVVQLLICNTCKFITVPTSFVQADGMSETIRGIRIDRVYAKSNTELFGADIEVPQNTPSVKFGMQYRCTNCTVPKDDEVNENIGIINLTR
jgi:hypothetical protein